MNTIEGIACQGVGRRESAEEYFRLSLRLDPFMWVNIQSLCELGADLDVEKHFEEAFFKRAAAAPAVDSTTAAPAATPAASGRAGISRFGATGAGAAAAGNAGGRPRAQQKVPPPPPPPPPSGVWAGSGHGGRSPPWASYMAFGRGAADRCPGYQKGDGGRFFSMCFLLLGVWVP